MFSRIIVSCMRISSNVYAFLGGIWISLATNIFSSLCFLPFNAKTQWHYYASTLLFTVAGALSMLIATKVGKMQDYTTKRNKGRTGSEKVIVAVTDDKKPLWYISFSIMILSILAGIVMLALNRIINPPSV